MNRSKLRQMRACALLMISSVLSFVASATDYTWTGEKSSVWDLTALNWTTGSGSCAFVAGGNAFFTGTSDATVTFGAAVNPAEVTVNKSSGTLTFDFSSAGSAYKPFSTVSTLTKKGAGTLYLYKSDNNGGLAGFSDAATLDIQGGTVELSCVNKKETICPKKINIANGATFHLAGRNSLGAPTESSATDLTTAGTLLFDAEGSSLACQQSIRTLTLEPGALFVAGYNSQGVTPATTIGNSLLQIQKSVVVTGSDTTPRTLSLSIQQTRQTQRFGDYGNKRDALEFQIDDVTQSVATDFTMQAPFTFWSKAADGKGAFRKTGSGTMLWANTFADGNAALDDTVAVEAGTLLFAAEQSLPNATVSVSENAAVGGAGSVKALTLASGAGLAVTAGQGNALTVAGDVALPAEGFVDVIAPDGAATAYGATVLTSSGSLSGTVTGWKVRVNGVETSDLPIEIRGNSLVIVAPELTWKANESFVWDLAAKNWSPNGVAPFSTFVEHAKALFTGADTETVTFGAAVHPSVVTVDKSAGTLTFDFTGLGTTLLPFSTVSSLTKKGAGTLYLYKADNNNGKAGFSDDATLDIQGGTLKLRCINQKETICPKQINIANGATFHLAGRNTLGTPELASATDITTAGSIVFNSEYPEPNLYTCQQAVRTLTLEPGASFVAGNCSQGWGSDATIDAALLQIQKSIVVTGDDARPRTLSLTIQQKRGSQRIDDYGKFGDTLEFQIDDVTKSGATDFTMQAPFTFYAKSASGKGAFRKTGSGTMLWANTFADGNAQLDDTVAIEAGTLLLAEGQALPNATVSVSASAAVGGSGSVKALTLAEGSGFVADCGQKIPLTVAGDVALPSAGFVDIRMDNFDASKVRARFVKTTGSLTGNVSGWTVKVNGVAHPELKLQIRGNELGIYKGLIIVVQ